jgi:hypothetical protein
MANITRTKQLTQVKQQLRDEAERAKKEREEFMKKALTPDGQWDLELREELEAEWEAQKGDDAPFSSVGRKRSWENKQKDIRDPDLYSAYVTQNEGFTKKNGIMWTQSGRDYAAVSQNACTQIDPSIAAEGMLSTVSRDISIRRGAMVMIVSGEYEYREKSCVTVMCEGQVFGGVPAKALRPISDE